MLYKTPKFRIADQYRGLRWLTRVRFRVQTWGHNKEGVEKRGVLFAPIQHHTGFQKNLSLKVSFCRSIRMKYCTLSFSVSTLTTKKRFSPNWNGSAFPRNVSFSGKSFPKQHATQTAVVLPCSISESSDGSNWIWTNTLESHSYLFCEFVSSFSSTTKVADDSQKDFSSI